MPKRADLSEDRKNEILDAALEVFSEIGLGDASVDDVVKRSGLSKGTLYWYFKSKDRLVGALMRRFFAQELEKVRQLQQGPGTVRERLLRYGRGVETVVMRMPRALTLEFYAVAVRQKSIRKFMGELYARYCAELAAVVGEGAKAGEFGEVDANQMAAAITGLCEGLILLWALAPDVFPFEKFFEPSLRTMLDGMKPEEASRAPEETPGAKDQESKG